MGGGFPSRQRSVLSECFLVYLVYLRKKKSIHRFKNWDMKGKIHPCGLCRFIIVLGLVVGRRAVAGGRKANHL